MRLRALVLDDGRFLEPPRVDLSPARPEDPGRHLLISGPPGAGKTCLLSNVGSELAQLFPVPATPPARGNFRGVQAWWRHGSPGLREPVRAPRLPAPGAPAERTQSAGPLAEELSVWMGRGEWPQLVLEWDGETEALREAAARSELIGLWRPEGEIGPLRFAEARRLKRAYGPLERATPDLLAWLAERRARQAQALRRGQEREAERLEEQLEAVRVLLAGMLDAPGLQFGGGSLGAPSLVWPGGRTVPVEALGAGRATLVSLLLELQARVEAARLGLGVSDHDPPGLLVLDRVEGYLDPAAQERVLPRLSHAFPGVQILASTQSPRVEAAVAEDPRWVRLQLREPQGVEAPEPA